MKILLLGTAYPWRGGIAHFNALLSKYLSKGHSVDVITFRRQYPAFLFPGKTQEEPNKPDIPLRTEQLIDSINPFNWIRVGLALRQRHADAVVLRYWLPFFGPCFGTICALVKWKRPTKVVAICDNIIPHERRPGDKIFTRFVFSMVDAFIVQSASVERDLHHLVRIPRYRRVAHPVYEFFGEALPKAEARRRLNISPADRIVLFFGYIRPYKGLHVLIDGVKAVLQSFPVRALVVGEFYEDEAPYRKHIHDSGLNEMVDVVPDYVPNEKVAEYFCASDVVVLPYRSATQSGIAQIAYHFDRPVIVTDVGGLGEVVIDDVSGFVVPPDDPTALARAIVRYFRDHREADLTEGVRREKKKYSWDRMVEAIEELVHT